MEVDVDDCIGDRPARAMIKDFASRFARKRRSLGRGEGEGWSREVEGVSGCGSIDADVDLT